MLKDIARCYADVLYLKATLRLPPSCVEAEHDRLRHLSLPPEPVQASGRRRTVLECIGDLIAGAPWSHSGIGANAVASKRDFRRIGS